VVREGRRYAPAQQLRPFAFSEGAKEAALGLVLTLPPMIMLVLLVVVPAVEALLFSLGLVPKDNVVFSTGLHLVSSPTPTLKVYRDLFASHFFVDDLVLTFSVTFATVALTVVISYVLALYVRFSSGTLPEIMRSLYLIPMFVPVVIASYALITFYVDHGLLQSLLVQVGLGYGSPIYAQSGVILGEVWTQIPFAVLMIGSGLDGLPQELVEAAQDVGAGFFSIIWRIVFPLNLVPVLIVATFSFIGVMGSFTVPYLIGPNAPQMLGVAMNAYFGTYQQPQPAVAIAVLTFVFASVAGAIYVWATSRSGRVA